MTNLIIKILDLSTGEEIEREMNEQEFAQYEAGQAAQAVRQAEAEAKATAKAALLEQLGITEEQAKLLLS
jgi:hypothetical protein